MPFSLSTLGNYPPVEKTGSQHTSTDELLFPDEEVSHGEIIEAAGKEGGESVKGGADHWLARHIEACVEDRRNAGEFLEFVDDLPVLGLTTPFNGLDPNRVIHMRGSLNILDYANLPLKGNDHEG